MAENTRIRKFLKTNDLSYLPPKCIDIVEEFVDWVQSNSYHPNSTKYQAEKFKTAMRIGVELGRLEAETFLPRMGKPRKMTVNGIEGWYELYMIPEEDIKLRDEVENNG